MRRRFCGRAFDIIGLEQSSIPPGRGLGRDCRGTEGENQLVGALAGEAEGIAAGSEKAEVPDRLAYGIQSF
jgi:hypothetical protein